MSESSTKKAKVASPTNGHDDGEETKQQQKHNDHKSNDDKMVLAYWKIRGLAQPIRLLLEYVGQAFEDKYYEQGDESHGFSRDEWLNDKEKLGMDFPNLPYLIHGDLKISQSNAILRYIANIHGLAGKTLQEQAILDELCGVAYDFRNKIVGTAYNSDYDRLIKDFEENYLPEHLPVYEQYLSKRDYFGGSSVAYVDFVFYELLDQSRMMVPKCLDKYPKLTAYLDRIEALPPIAAYLKSSRYFKHPVNNKTAKFK